MASGVRIVKDSFWKGTVFNWMIINFSLKTVNCRTSRDGEVLVNNGGYAS